MARKFYDDKTRAAIVTAATIARKDGTWKEAHEKAKAAGYKGSMQGIIKMLGGVGKKRGRKNKGKVGRPAKASNNGTGIGSIEAMVDKVVQQRMRQAIDSAIAALERFK